MKEGTLFDVPAVGLHEEREETRRTLTERCEKAAELLADADPGIAWCHLNDEGDLLARLIPGAVQVAGSDPVEAKEERLAAFGRGEIRVLVTKPRIASWGLNYQNCHRMTYFTDHSYEAYVPGGPPMLAVRPAAPGDRGRGHDHGRETGPGQPGTQSHPGGRDVHRPDRAHERRARPSPAASLTAKTRRSPHGPGSRPGGHGPVRAAQRRRDGSHDRIPGRVHARGGLLPAVRLRRRRPRRRRPVQVQLERAGPVQRRRVHRVLRACTGFSSANCTG